MNICKRFIITILISIGIIIGFNGISYASSVSVNASKKTVSAGEQFEVTITGNDATGKINISIGNGSGSKSSVWIENNSQSIQVTAGSSGTVSISVTGEVSDSSGNDQNVSASTSVAIKEENNSSNNSNENNNQSSEDKSGQDKSGNTENKKSSNANLSNLVVSPVDFKGFKASKTSGYTVTVDNDVKEVTIKATTQDSKAKVDISGNKNLKVGENTVNVKVTAEDGTEKTYKIIVIRKAENSNDEENSTSKPTPEPTPESTPETTPTPTPENKEKTEEVLGITSLKLIGNTKNGVTIEPNIVPEFKTDVYEYKTTVSVDVESIDVKVLTNMPNAEVEIMGNKNLVVGENIITILVKAANTEQKSYQIIVNKTEESLNLDNNTELIKNIITGTIIVILLVAIIIAILIYRSGRKDEIIAKKDRYVNIANNLSENEKKDYKQEYLDGFNKESKEHSSEKKNGKRFK